MHLIIQHIYMLYPRGNSRVNPGLQSRLGIGSYAYRYAIGVDGFSPPRPIGVMDFIRAARALGASGVQLCENLSYEKASLVELEPIGDFCKREGMFIELGMRGLTDESLLQHIALAETLGAKLIRLVLGRPSNHSCERSDELVEHGIGVLRGAIARLEKANIYVGIENHFDLRTERIMHVVEAVASDRIGFVFDTTNGIGFVERPEETLEMLLPRLLSLHIKDYTMVKVEAGYEMRGCVLGEGWLDYQWILNKVLTARPESSLILELTVRRKDGQTPAEAVRVEADMISQSFQALQHAVETMPEECGQ